MKHWILQINRKSFGKRIDLVYIKMKNVHFAWGSSLPFLAVIVILGDTCKALSLRGLWSDWWIKRQRATLHVGSQMEQKGKRGNLLSRAGTHSSSLRHQNLRFSGFWPPPSCLVLGPSDWAWPKYVALLSLQDHMFIPPDKSSHTSIHAYPIGSVSGEL
jgi:hypothetical protein